MQNLFEELVPQWYYIKQETYNAYHIEFGSAYYELLSKNPVICTVHMETNITISNEIFLPVHKLLYQIEFNVTGDRLFGITIRNNTFENLYFHLDNSKGSVNIEENVFIGSGIKFIKEVKDSAVSIILENNIFQGNYKRPVVDLQNINSVSFRKNYFENLHSYLYNSILQFDSIELQLLDILFKNTQVQTVKHLDNCFVEMNNVSFVEKPFFHLYEVQTVVEMETTNGTFSNMIFVENNGSNLFSVRKGELLLQNITFSRNKLHWYRDEDAVITVY